MTSLPPPGWYRDPRDPDQPHYWDGQRWAELTPKAPTPPAEPPLSEDESAPSPSRPPVSRPPADTRKRSRVVVAGLVTFAVIALIAIGAAVQSLSGGGHKSAPPTRSSVSTTGLPTSPQ